MAWLQVSLTVDAARVEAVENLFMDLGALSITNLDAADQPLLEPGPGETPLWRSTQITALFPEDQQLKPLQASLAGGLAADILATLAVERLEDQVWERVWLADFHPMCFGSRLWVCPAGQRPDQADALILDLDPGLAFGTGTHPTTALCLRWLDGADLTGRRVIDFGCGSGILAIAAALLGAQEIIAVDHDPQALKATRDNAEKNQVLDRIQILAPEQVPQIQVDVLVANILAGTLIRLAPQVQSLLRPGGHLILAGLLEDQADAVAAAYVGGCRMDAPVQDQEWVLLHGRRRQETGPC